MSTSLAISDGGHLHTLTIVSGTRFYTRGRSDSDGVSVRSVYYSRADWEAARKCYAGRFPMMVEVFK